MVDQKIIIAILLVIILIVIIYTFKKENLENYPSQQEINEYVKKKLDAYSKSDELKDNLFSQLMYITMALQSQEYNVKYGIGANIRFYGMFESRPLDRVITDYNNGANMENIYLYDKVNRMIMVIYNTSEKAGIIILQLYGNIGFKHYIFKSIKIVPSYKESDVKQINLYITDLQNNQHIYSFVYGKYQNIDLNLQNILQLGKLPNNTALISDLYQNKLGVPQDITVLLYDMFKEQEPQAPQQQQQPQVIPSCPTCPVCQKCPQIKFVNKNGLTKNMIKVKGGSENNKALYVCSARFANGSHPGKTWDGYNNCNIGYGRRERAVSDFDYLVIE
jgi:hypothetical protein